MNFLADEGVDFPVVQRLRGDGHEVLYVAEMDPGISDEKVLAAANDKNALLLLERLPILKDGDFKDQ